MSAATKPPPSHKNVETTLRHSIVTGELRPGSRLPNRSEIERRFGVSMPTVQKALDALMRDGFVHARPGAGTFVVDNPPHLCRYGLVFPDPKFQSRFYQTLREAAETAALQRKVRISDYFHHDPTANRRLSDDVADYRLAGAIFVHPQWDLWDSLAIKTPGVPRVIIAGETRNGIPALDVNMPQFYPRAIDHLAARGRKKIAVVYPDSGHHVEEQFGQHMRARGLEVRPYWTCAVAREMLGRAVETTVRLLLELSEEKRPDALVIVDDNLLEPVLCAVMSSSVRVPDQLEIVTHCNYPLPAGGKLPVTRLGFDCKQLIDLAMQRLDDQRHGRKSPEKTLLDPIFEDEWKASGGAPSSTAQRNGWDMPSRS